MSMVDVWKDTWDTWRWEVGARVGEVLPLGIPLLVVGLAFTWGFVPTLAILAWIATVWAWAGLLLRIDRLAWAPVVGALHAGTSVLAAVQRPDLALGWWAPRWDEGGVVWGPLLGWEAALVSGALLPGVAVLGFVLMVGVLRMATRAVLFLHRLGDG